MQHAKVHFSSYSLLLGRLSKSLTCLTGFLTPWFMYPVYLLLPASAKSNNTSCAGSIHVHLYEVSRPICSEKETYSYTKCHLLQTIGGTYM